MKILVIGNGGREHALAWKIAQSSKVVEVLVAPGNAGTAAEPKVRNVACPADDIDGLVALARSERVSLTLVGPEISLALGVVDKFTAAGLRCFGPTQAAAQLESSKRFCKEFLVRHHIPTGHYASFTDETAAAAYLSKQIFPVVIKADGLAGGKGVVIAPTLDSAIGAVHSMLAERRFGSAGKTIILEQFLRGEEASFIVMCDGEHILPLATSQDHKALYDGDRGPNTGGMGAYSPAPVVTPAIFDRVMREVIRPTVDGMAALGTPYIGFLYAGLMISPEGVPFVLEYNCRFGDPETQPVMMRLRSDLVELCNAALDGQLHRVRAEWDPRPALGVVMAAGGYPDLYRQGDSIEGLAGADNATTKVFHAGTSQQGNNTLTHGGRVLCVTALGDTLAQAQHNAYQAVQGIHWPGVHYRKDIGYRALKNGP